MSNEGPKFITELPLKAVPSLTDNVAIDDGVKTWYTTIEAIAALISVTNNILRLPAGTSIDATLRAIVDGLGVATGMQVSTTILQYNGDFRIAFSDTQYLKVTSPSAGVSKLDVIGGVGQALQFAMGGNFIGYIDQAANIHLSVSTPGSNGSRIVGYDANLIPATAGLGFKSHNGYVSFYDTLTGAIPTFIIGNGLVIGGVGTTSTLKLRATYGVGAIGSKIVFQVGNNGSIDAGEIDYLGVWSGMRIKPRTLVQNAPGATPSINSDIIDFQAFTGLATAITSMTTNLTGTPTEAQKLWLAFTDNGTARAIAWGASFENGAATLPTTTVISTRLDVGFIWNTVTSKWRCVAAG